MPSPGVACAVSDYEHITAQYPATSLDGADESGDELDAFLQLKRAPNASYHPPQSQKPSSSLFSQSQNRNANNVSGVNMRNTIGLTELLDDFGGASEQIPMPSAWSPGFTKTDPSVFNTPQKGKQNEGVGKGFVSEPQRKSKVPQPTSYSPNVGFIPNPALLITPEKPLTMTSSSKNMLENIMTMQNENTLKTKHSVRFDLPSSHEQTLDTSGESQLLPTSPITLRGAQMVSDSEAFTPVWKGFSPQKAYNPGAYSDESALEDSAIDFTSDKASHHESHLPTISTSDRLADQLHELLLSSKSALGNNSFPSALPEHLSNPKINSSSHSKMVCPDTAEPDLGYDSLPLVNSVPAGDKPKDIHVITRKTKKFKDRESSPSSKRIGPECLKDPPGPYEPKPSGSIIIREVPNFIDACPSVSAYSFPFEAGAVGGDHEFEHVFARPEFNSTLKVRGELDQLCEKEVDVARAVESALAKSESKRMELGEKAASYTNRMSNQFRNLVDLDASVEKLCDRVVRMRTSKSRKKPPKIEKSGTEYSAPDLMEFFTPEFQKERTNFNLPGVAPVTPHLRIAPHDMAFDLYRHNRMWNGINDL